jgi:hypothetical protein
MEKRSRISSASVTQVISHAITAHVTNSTRRAPEYRIRRESLNQLRRAIKAEIEGVWQSDQMRHGPIPGTS